MSIVVDINALAPVFNSSCVEHAEFAPVEDWIRNGDGLLVFGGTKYREELSSSGRYLNVVVELKRSRRAVEVQETLVDQAERHIRSLTENRAFNDHHIIAIIRVSGCRLLCTKNSQHDRFFKDRTLYSRGQRPPKIYRSRSHRRLLCPANCVTPQNTV